MDLIYRPSETVLYDSIGRGYTATRDTDPRIAEAIWGALGEARSVLNVGAGAGAYEPRDRQVLAVEPSTVMIAQRPADAAPCRDGGSQRPPLARPATGAARAAAGSAPPCGVIQRRSCAG